MSIDTTQALVLERIVARLRDELGLTERTCFETLEPRSPISVPPGGGTFLTVALGAGRFDEPMQIGGAQHVCYERTSIAVTIYSRLKLDSGHHAASQLRDATRGLLAQKHAVLRALVGHDLQDLAGDSILGQWVAAVQAWPPRYDPESGLAMLAVEFATDFVWDLT